MAFRLPLFLIAASALTAACSPNTSSSRTQDIYKEDQGDPTNGNDRRRPATSNDRLWTVRIPATLAGQEVPGAGRCSASLVAPDVVITAGHCNVQVNEHLTSGVAINNQQSDDMTVTKILEQAGVNGVAANLDYALLQVTWTNGQPPTGQLWAPTISTAASDVQTSATYGSGDQVFTVGFPVDKASTWGATYSTGNAKNMDSANSRLLFDMGIINGNSGGGVWRNKDNMLVSLANNGVHSLSSPNQTDTSWESDTATDAADWNFGPAMYAIYAQSATLQNIFPNGQNRYTLSGGTPPTGGGTPTTGSGIWMAIGTADPTTQDAYTLYASVPAAAVEVFWCPNVTTPDQCSASASGFMASTAVQTVGTQGIFQGQGSTQLADGETILVVARDAQRNVLATRTVGVKKQ